MRFLLPILLIAWSCHAQTFSGLTIQGVHITTNQPSGGGGGGATYLLNENFEGAGYENAGWSTVQGTINADNTTNVLAGSQSLAVHANSIARYGSYTANDQVWVYFLFKPLALRDWWACEILDSTDTAVCIFQFNAGGQVTITDNAFHANTTVGTMTAGNTYHVWMRYQKGTGANAQMEIWFSTDGTKPGTGDFTVLANNGNGTTQASKIQLMTEAGTAASFIFDKLRVDDVAIPSNPD